MILVADSGSTKTQWGYIHDKEVRFVTTPGYNPYFVDGDFVTQSLIKELLPYINESTVTDVYFYGSGCSTSEKQAVIHSAVRSVIPGAYIEVNHDLLGAARALFAGTPGIACILGTGSNSCYYDGKDIIENVTSLGYIFGDEGGGVYIGKKLLGDFLRDKLPAELDQLFRATFQLDVHAILDAIYKKPRPNTFIAGFSRFVGENIQHAYMQGIVRESFHDFFDYQLKKYSHFGSAPIGCVGAVAYNYSDILRSVAGEYGISTINIHNSPTESLVHYHINT
jgi:glucosamine kinase